MQTYEIDQPGIASVLYIKVNGERAYCALYMGPDPLPTQGGQGRVRWEREASCFMANPEEVLPLHVVAAVNRHFGTVFALPPEQREAYLQQLRIQGGLSV